MPQLIMGMKSGMSVKKDIAENDFKHLLGKKIKDHVKGESIGYPGYEFEVMGGSDYCGFPMRWDVPGVARKRILAVAGVGLKKTANGIKHRKTVCGNTIHPKITQVNLKVLKEGATPLAVPKAEGEKKEAEAKK